MFPPRYDPHGKTPERVTHVDRHLLIGVVTRMNKHPRELPMWSDMSTKTIVAIAGPRCDFYKAASKNIQQSSVRDGCCIK